jgi:osmotically-inducible protein OsmY
MKVITYILKVLVTVCILLGLNACIAPMLIGGTAAMGGRVTMQEKTIGESISDTTIWTKIRSGLIHNDIDGLFGSVNIEVNEGKVLLTGSVENKESIISILRIVWQQDGVKDVINELKIIPKEEKSGVFDYTKDSWITTQIKTKLLLNSNVRSVNYGVETIDGTVYLFGIARTQEEIEEVKDVVSSVNGVKEVKSYVRAKKDAYARIEDTRGSSSVKSESTGEKKPLEEDEIFEEE